MQRAFWIGAMVMAVTGCQAPPVAAGAALDGVLSHNGGAFVAAPAARLPR